MLADHFVVAKIIDNKPGLDSKWEMIIKEYNDKESINIKSQCSEFSLKDKYSKQ